MSQGSQKAKEDMDSKGPAMPLGRVALQRNKYLFYTYYKGWRELFVGFAVYILQTI